QAPQGFERPPAPVSVAEAVARDVPLYLDQVGKVVARELVDVKPQLSGRILQIHFTDGADVRKGQLLFTIDPRPFQAQLAAAQGTVAQSKAMLDFARIQVDRAAGLIQTKAISQLEYDQRKNAFAVARAQIQQGEAAVETARLNLQYCQIHSPIDGRAGRRLVDPGNVVKPDSTAELRPVVTGQRQGDLVVISQGVKPGEKVVVNGQLGVTPGGKVRELAQPAANPEAPPAPQPTARPGEAAGGQKS